VNRLHTAARRAIIAAALASTAPCSLAAETVQLLFAGDVVLDDTAGAMIARGEDPFRGFAPLFAQGDIRLANLECVIATTGSAGDKNYTFRAHPRVLPVLKRHFDAVALANNHSGDYGRGAFAEMLGLLQGANIAQVGGGHNLSQAHTPLIVERKGLRVALLSYNEFMPRSFEASSHAPGIAWSEDEQVVADIRAARTVHRADLVIPVMHWGWENEPLANARQRQLARILVGAGADAVIGGHPHVRQDIEIINGKPVIYSVGNFVMKETDNPEQRIGWVLELNLDKAGVSSWRTHTARLDLEGIPTPQASRSPSPCGRRGQTTPQDCEPGQQP
jgi:hypothetical protein